MISIRRILVPIDFSSGSDAALTTALALAQKLDAALVLAHVLESPSFMELEPAPEDALTSTRPMRAKRAFARERAEVEMRRVLARVTNLEPHGLEMIVLEGEPSRAIADAAKEARIDLIVMGTHGRTGLAHLVLGSVAERVLRAAHCPVLTVHIGPKERAA